MQAYAFSWGQTFPLVLGECPCMLWHVALCPRWGRGGLTWGAGGLLVLQQQWSGSRESGQPLELGSSQPGSGLGWYMLPPHAPFCFFPLRVFLTLVSSGVNFPFPSLPPCCKLAIQGTPACAAYGAMWVCNAACHTCMLVWMCPRAY